MCLPVCDLKLTRRAALSVVLPASHAGAAGLQAGFAAPGRASQASPGELRAPDVSGSLTLNKIAGRTSER